MSKTIHCCLSIEGSLMNPKPWVGCITVEGKLLDTKEKVQWFLMDQLKQGHEVLSMGGCDNFDYKKGCLGHEKDNADDH